jgi:hypothetical protein
MEVKSQKSTFDGRFFHTLMEFKCVEFVEALICGHLCKQPR